MQIGGVQQIGEMFFLASFVGDIALFVCVTLAILVMHFLMPQAVLEKYFKRPHFGELERRLFTGAPYAPVRTLMFMRAIAYPKSGRKRGITEAHSLVPAWYRTASKVVVVSILLLDAVILLQLVGFAVLIWLHGAAAQ